MKTRMTLIVGAAAILGGCLEKTFAGAMVVSHGGGQVGETPSFQLYQQPGITLIPKDPSRILDDTIWAVKGVDEKNGWVAFSGKALEIQPGGVRFDGSYTGYGSGEFFVENFPYEIAEGEYIGADQKTRTFYCAKTSGTYTYQTVLGGSRTIRKLDYGKIYTPPPPPPPTAEEIAAAKAAEAKRKSEAAAKTLKWNQDQAEAGDEYGELRMGERYLKGDGVEKDEAKAREYLGKSAAQGNREAGEMLNGLK